jgi:HicB family
MDLTPYVAALRDDLAAAAAVGDEATTRAGNSLAAALEPAVRLALMNALSDLAGEVSESLGDRSVSLRLSGREVQVVVDRSPSSEDGGFFAGPASSPFAGAPSGGANGPHRPTPPPGPGFPGGEGPWGAFGGGGQGFGGQGFGGRGGPDVGDISRMTLRLVDQIKGQAERAAAAQGMSLNSWIAQAVQGALRQHGGRGGWGGWGTGGDSGGDSGGDPGGSTGGSWDSGWDAGRAARDESSSTGPTSPTSPTSPTDSTPTGSTPADSTPSTDSPGSGKPGPDSPGSGKPGPDGPDGGGVDGWVRG